MTFNPSIFASALMISSVMPSQKNSFSPSALMLTNGSTAMDLSNLSVNSYWVSIVTNKCINALRLSAT